MKITIELDEAEKIEIKEHLDKALSSFNKQPMRKETARHMIMHRLLNADVVYKAVDELAKEF